LEIANSVAPSFAMSASKILMRLALQLEDAIRRGLMSNMGRTKNNVRVSKSKKELEES
jgi:hypothetical protein